MGGGRERAAMRSAGESLPHIIITNNQWEQDREMLFMSSAPEKEEKKDNSGVCKCVLPASQPASSLPFVTFGCPVTMNGEDHIE